MKDLPESNRYNIDNIFMKDISREALNPNLLCRMFQNVYDEKTIVHIRIH